MEKILQLSQQNQQKAWKIIEESNIVSIWKSIGAEVNLVGSLKSGLMVKNRDIDMHIYSNPLLISESFSAIAKFAENPAVKHIEYNNLIDTEEECIEWHISYEDKNKELWKFDLIHIRKGSTFDGYIEKVTDAIVDALTPENKHAILQIKYAVPDNEQATGIEIYRAVFEGGVRTYPEFVIWRKTHPFTGTLEWMP